MYNSKDRNLDGQVDRSKEESTPAFFIYNVVQRTFNKNNMNKYKVIKNKLGWMGIWQTKQNWKNIFQIYWCFICTELHPARELGLTFLGFVIFGKHRSLLRFRFYDWGASKLGHPKMGMLNIGIFYLPHIDFRIGNGKTWFYIRNEQFYHYRNKNKCSMPF